MTTPDQLNVSEQELADVVRGIRAASESSPEGDDPDLTGAESPGVAAVRARLEEPFDYEKPERPNIEGYA